MALFADLVCYCLLFTGLVVVVVVVVVYLCEMEGGGGESVMETGLGVEVGVA